MRWESCLICLLLCARAATAAAAPFAYLANNGPGTLAVIDTATNVVVTTVPVGNDPLGVAVDPDGALVYVTNQVSLGTVRIFDTASGTVTATVPVGDDPTGVAVKLPGTRVYVANRRGKDVSVIDTATNTVIATVPVGNNPLGVAVNPAGTPAYVANKGSDTLSVIDTDTNTVIATVATGPPGGSPTHVAVNPAGSRVYVTNNAGASLAVIDTATDDVLTTIPVGSFPEGVAVDPTGARVYVANQGPGTVSVIDAVSNLVVATVPVGQNPEDLAVDPSGARVYVTNRGDASVSVINTASNTEIDIDGNPLNGITRITVGQSPVGLGAFIMPALRAPGFSKQALACQAALAARARAFAVVDQVQQTACRNRVLKDVAEGKGTQQAEATCALALDLGNPESALARAHTKTTGAIAKKCGAFTPAAINAPCDRSATTFGATADCVLAQHLGQVEAMMAATFAAGDPQVLSKSARACQATIAMSARGFAASVQRALLACVNGVLKAASAGKDPAKAAAACARLLDPANPKSTRAQGRASAAAKIVRKCAAVAPAELGNPCDASATTFAEVADCVLDMHATRVEKMVAAEYNDVCSILTALGLGRAFPGVCTGP